MTNEEHNQESTESQEILETPAPAEVPSPPAERFSCYRCGRRARELSGPGQFCPRCNPSGYAPVVIAPTQALARRSTTRAAKRLIVCQKYRGEISEYAMRSAADLRRRLEKHLKDHGIVVGPGHQVLVAQATEAWRGAVELGRRVNEKGDELPMDEYGPARERQQRLFRYCVDCLRELGFDMSVDLRSITMGLPAGSAVEVTEKRVRVTTPMDDREDRDDEQKLIEGEITDAHSDPGDHRRQQG